jgi:hypothetical protein
LSIEDRLKAGEILLASKSVESVPCLIERSGQENAAILPTLIDLATHGSITLRVLILKGIRRAHHDNHALEFAMHLINHKGPVSAEKILAADLLRYEPDFDQLVTNTFLQAQEHSELRGWAAELWDQGVFADFA